MVFLQNLVKSVGTAEVFPADFPHAIHQALALPLAEPRMSQADITRSVYTLVAAGAEMTVIVHLMRLHWARLLAVMDGEPVAILIMEVEPEEFDFNGNLHND